MDVCKRVVMYSICLLKAATGSRDFVAAGSPTSLKSGPGHVNCRWHGICSRSPQVAGSHENRGLLSTKIIIFSKVPSKISTLLLSHCHYTEIFNVTCMDGIVKDFL